MLLVKISGKTFDAALSEDVTDVPREAGWPAPSFRAVGKGTQALYRLYPAQARDMLDHLTRQAATFASAGDDHSTAEARAMRRDAERLAELLQTEPKEETMPETEPAAERPATFPHVDGNGNLTHRTADTGETVPALDPESPAAREALAYSRGVDEGLRRALAKAEEARDVATVRGEDNETAFVIAALRAELEG